MLLEINILFLLLINSSWGLTSDEITSLPGLKQKPSFKQYSGYLRGGPEEYLHYWFVESQGNPSTDPVVLWLNGGPGCSSLLGFFTENGPFKVSNDGKTVSLYEYSWNKLANVLYLESPVGVGFSYTTKSGTFISNDNNTAHMNYLAVEDFFSKFPQFANHSFYITGESYGGIYVPTLAKEFYDNKSKINLKGIAVGNGFLDVAKLAKSSIELANAHGMIDDDFYAELVEKGCECTNDTKELCGTENLSKTCKQLLQQFANIMSEMPNPYNVLSDCRPPMFYARYSPFVRLFYDNQLSQDSLSSKAECESSGYISYLNSADVRKAIHIPDKVKTWTSCFESINYTMQHPTMKQVVQQLITQNKISKLIIYNGDLDLSCDFLGDERFVDQLGYKVTDKYKLWRVGGRIAGFVKRYEGITFTTIRGAGHFVPTDQPEAGLAVLKELLGISKLI